MVDTFKLKIARMLVPRVFLELDLKEKVLDVERASLRARQDQFSALVDQRVAQTLLTMDPFEPLMRKFAGIFSEEFEKPEQRLDERSSFQMKMWAYQQVTDPSFKYFMDWVINTQGNATLKKGNPTPEVILFGRAMVAAPLLLKKEMQRLASLYQEVLDERNASGFDETEAME